jgi:hypothetical protein
MLPPLWLAGAPEKRAWARKKPASVAAGVLSFDSEFKSGQHPARSCGAMVMVMTDCAGCCSCGHEGSVYQMGCWHGGHSCCAESGRELEFEVKKAHDRGSE